ncbi:uncharacterized protein RNJ42_02291 [Nakaseomyces bracarensis]|uniref:uncharacterized protein n=1 Tax=Nakaseomyces bracarensis TaxID=273131 RepID=UPI003871833B
MKQEIDLEKAPELTQDDTPIDSSLDPEQEPNYFGVYLTAHKYRRSLLICLHLLFAICYNFYTLFKPTTSGYSISKYTQTELALLSSVSVVLLMPTTAATTYYYRLAKKKFISWNLLIVLALYSLMVVLLVTATAFHSMMFAIVIYEAAMSMLQ